MSALGKLVPPYPAKHCAAMDCHVELTEESGAYLFRDIETGKLVVFCEATAGYVELNRSERWKLVAL